MAGKPVATHLYTFKELEALQKGGVQRIFTGNVRTGAHDLSVTFTGKSKNGDAIGKTERFSLAKEVGPKIVELHLAANAIVYKDR
jgi:hypothetical protein